VVLSAAPDEVEKLRGLFEGIEFTVIGRVLSAPRLRVAKVIDEDVPELRQIHEQAIARRLATNG
jgi:selenophosphate synthetase-related protein